MSQRFRWERLLPGDATATVTRVVGDHELPAEGNQRRFRVDCQAPVEDAPVDTGTATVSENGTVTVDLPADAGLAWLRVAVADGTSRISLPGPAFEDRLTAALDGDDGAARALVRDAGGVVALALSAGEFLDPSALVALLDAARCIASATTAGSDTSPMASMPSSPVTSVSTASGPSSRGPASVASIALARS